MRQTTHHKHDKEDASVFHTTSSPSFSSNGIQPEHRPVNLSNDTDESLKFVNEDVDNNTSSQSNRERGKTHEQQRHQDNDARDPNLAWKHIQSTQRFLSVPTISAATANANASTTLRLVVMSDTHGKHRLVTVPATGHVLIHAGDWTQYGEIGTIHDLIAYFGQLQSSTATSDAPTPPATHTTQRHQSPQQQQHYFEQVICIAGNHEISMDLPFYERHWRRFHDKRQRIRDPTMIYAALQESCIYLHDSSVTLPPERGGLTIYGSPVTPTYLQWAFNVNRGAPIRAVWDRIPDETDILITHGPPLGRGDQTVHSGHAGCADLLYAVQNRIRPRVHIFGHIHEDYGVTFDGTTLFINAANVDLHYKAIHPCWVIDVPHDRSLPAHIVEPVCTVQASELADWMQCRGYHSVADACRKVSVEILPSGSQLLQVDAAWALSRALKFHNDQQKQLQIKHALAQMYAESF